MFTVLRWCTVSNFCFCFVFRGRAAIILVHRGPVCQVSFVDIYLRHAKTTDEAKSSLWSSGSRHRRNYHRIELSNTIPSTRLSISHNTRERSGQSTQTQRKRNTMGEGDPIDIKWIMTQVLVRQQATRNRTKSFDWGGTDHIDKTDFAPSAAIDS